ncbi:MAG: peptidoglycan DD-metalloendopeptidase family protein [Bdellovibrionales bacterium]|nr:peptidoglycan DD-metalloendopeptidase family protein [Bdellovibrionales bacterium]
MKRQKYYTLIFLSNSTGAVKKIHFPQKTLKIFLTGLACLFAALVLFLTDYFGLAVQQMEVRHLRSENQKLKKEFALVTAEFQELKQDVFQLNDFTRKIRLITNLDVLQDNHPHLGYGKTSSPSSLMQLSHPDPVPSLRSPAGEQKDSKPSFHSVKEITYGELQVKIKDLRKKSQLVKQNAWDIYSSFLEDKVLLSGTPSILPVRGGWITSHYGFRNETLYADHDPQFHNGMDIAAKAGSPVLATADGCVQFIGYDEGGYGKLIVIDHGSDVATYYAHLSEVKIKPNQSKTRHCVKRGEVIGAVGSTGKSTGPHLHYEVRVLGTPVNPKYYMLAGDPITGLALLGMGRGSSYSLFPSLKK